ncbi:MAG TPA: methylated-DNA--[protein]-cysteine S-methyltransferase [Candidatus Sulfopaludibacter sp.]|nr:methylated-DNA--[protein]-cysteine S-methyltransferase [Candidatus Sulfopaludibacter sp.]
MRAAYQWMETPIGRLMLVADEAGLREVWFEKGRTAPVIDPGWQSGGSPLDEPARQLHAYFAGELQRFDLVLQPEGTPFQLRVWDLLTNIPFGETISYGELARRAGNPAASRAVGLANGSNPIPIVIPCHRVIGSNGKLTGYGGGLETKRWLLDFECTQMKLPLG